MNSLKLVTPNDDSPITLEETKAHLRVDHDDDDTLIQTYIDAATEHAESFMGISLMEKTWDYYLDCYPCNGKPIVLPRPPLLAVTQFDDGESPSFSDYQVDLAGGRLYLPLGGSWPTTTGTVSVARIRYRAGYTDIEDVPNDIRAALLLTVGTLYENRETVVIGQTPSLLPWSAEQLLRRHRVETSLA